MGQKSRPKLEISYWWMPGGVEGFAGFDVEVGGGVVVGDVVGVVSGASSDEFAAEAGVVVDFEHVDGDVRDPGGDDLGERVGPGFCGLVWEAGDEVERDLGDAGRAEIGDVAQGDLASVEAAHGARFLIDERLHAEGDTVHAGVDQDLEDFGRERSGGDFNGDFSISAER